MNMEPNYPNYTDDELLQALCSINRTRFPQRVALLQQELTKRGITYEEQQLPSGEWQLAAVKYRQQASNSQQVAGDVTAKKEQNYMWSILAVVIGIGCLMVLNLRSFGLSSRISKFSLPIMLCLAISAGYICWRLWKKAQHHDDSWFWAEIKTLDKFISNAVLLSLVSGFTLFHFGVLAFHHVTSMPSEQQAKIISIHNKPQQRRLGGRRSRSSPCSYSMRAELPGFRVFEWCHQPQSLLNQIEVGDPIALKGQVSAAGFYVDSFQLKPAHSTN